jgi:hypothetical protein
LVGFYTTASNEFSSDFENVMQKYPAIDLVQFSVNNSMDQVNIQLDSAAYSNLLNCELVMGEDRFIEEAIPHKVVMIDVDGRIRGYFMLDDLEEIERLDIELDILLNY